MRCKGRSDKRMLRRFLLCLAFSTLVLPINFKGLPYAKVYGLNKTYPTFNNIDQKLIEQIRIRRGEGTDYQDITSEKMATPYDQNGAMNENPEMLENQSVIKISPSVIGSMVLIFFMTPFFTLFMLSYLQEQPLNKQCLMNRLYQDLVKANLLLVWLWICSALIFKYSTGDSTFVEKSLAKCVALVNQALYLFIFLNLSLMGLLRLCIIRFKVLDPVVQWFGEDDDTAMKKIRLIVFAFVTCVIGIICICSTNPPVYYQMHGSGKMSFELPPGSFAIRIADMIILVICACLHIAGKIYQHIEDSRLTNNHIAFERQSNTNNETNETTERNGSNDFQEQCQTNTSSNGGNLIVHKFIIPALLYMGNTTVITLLLLLGTFRPFNNIEINFWVGMTIFLGFQGVLIPFWFILWYTDLRNHVVRRIRYFVGGILGWLERIVKRGRAKVEPAQQMIAILE